jgi:hypothetical protein
VCEIYLKRKLTTKLQLLHNTVEEEKYGGVEVLLHAFYTLCKKEVNRIE